MPIVFRDKGLCDYQSIWKQMIDFTRNRQADTPDEVWFLQHHPVYTLGTSCKEIPMAEGQHIEVVKSDRGGQTTYHGPGQLIVYLLMDIKRLNTGPRSLVQNIEQLIIDTLAQWQIPSERKPGAPGVYVEGKKIAALGLRISRGYCYHGLSINVDMDLQPFQWIKPCGHADLEVTQIKAFNHKTNIDRLTAYLRDEIALRLV